MVGITGQSVPILLLGSEGSSAARRCAFLSHEDGQNARGGGIFSPQTAPSSTVRAPPGFAGDDGFHGLQHAERRDGPTGAFLEQA
jgi:hypothetical protein